MSRSLLIILVSLALLTAGCVAKGDEAEPGTGGPRGASDDERTNEPATRPQPPPVDTWINGVPCASGTPETMALLVYEPPADAAVHTTADVTVPANTTRMWLSMEHALPAAGQYDVRLEGPDGIILDHAASGAWMHGATLTSGATGSAAHNAPTPGTHTFAWAATGAFAGTRIVVAAHVCL